MAQSGYRRCWLPPAIATGGAARWVYVPSSVLRSLGDYAQFDRRAVVEAAQATGRYKSFTDRMLVLDRDRGIACRVGASARVKVAHLSPDERRLLLIDGPAGLEPAALWLSEHGMPVSVATWKDMLRQANERCAKHGLELHGPARTGWRCDAASLLVASLLARLPWCRQRLSACQAGCVAPTQACGPKWGEQWGVLACQLSCDAGA